MDAVEVTKKLFELIESRETGPRQNSCRTTLRFQDRSLTLSTVRRGWVCTTA